VGGEGRKSSGHHSHRFETVKPDDDEVFLRKGGNAAEVFGIARTKTPGLWFSSFG